VGDGPFKVNEEEGSGKQGREFSYLLALTFVRCIVGCRAWV